MVEIKITRHVAKIANTDQRCVVAFMQIPGAEDFSLIIPTDNLPLRFEQAVMSVLESAQGQQEETFAKILSMHRMPDTGETILEALHNAKKLVKIPVANILMLPVPNQPVKLTHILENWPGGSRLKGNNPSGQQNMADHYAKEKFNPHTHNQKAESNENQKAIARNLLLEAELLENDAKKKRNAAYNYDASLRPIENSGVITPQTTWASLAAQPMTTQSFATDFSNFGMTGNDAMVVADYDVISEPVQDSGLLGRMENLEKSLGMIMEAVTKITSPVATQKIDLCESVLRDEVSTTDVV